MLAKLIQDVTDAVVPSRSLDVTLHEVLTGELCQGGKTTKPTYHHTQHHAHGEILREHGGELLWWSVPAYTSIIEPTANFLATRNYTLTVTTVLPQTIKDKKKEGIDLHFWNMSARSDTGPDEMISFAAHNFPGLCGALLCLNVVNRPAGAMTCTSCALPFVLDEISKERIKDIPVEVLHNSPKLCHSCSLAIVEDMERNREISFPGGRDGRDGEWNG